MEKYRAWSDCDGDMSRRFTDDFVLTQASLYWFTNTISTSFRPYYEQAHGIREKVSGWTCRPLQLVVHLVGDAFPVPTPRALAVFPSDLTQPPRSWAERTSS